MNQLRIAHLPGYVPGFVDELAKEWHCYTGGRKSFIDNIGRPTASVAVQTQVPIEILECARYANSFGRNAGESHFAFEDIIREVLYHSTGYPMPNLWTKISPDGKMAYPTGYRETRRLHDVGHMPSVFALGRFSLNVAALSYNLCEVTLGPDGRLNYRHLNEVPSVTNCYVIIEKVDQSEIPGRAKRVDEGLNLRVTRFGEAHHLMLKSDGVEVIF